MRSKSDFNRGRSLIRTEWRRKNPISNAFQQLQTDLENTTSGKHDSDTVLNAPVQLVDPNSKNPLHVEPEIVDDHEEVDIERVRSPAPFP